MVMFNTRMRPEVIQPFWAALHAGEFISAAAEGVGTYRVKGRRWILAESGIRPRRGRHLKGRCLTLTEREEIAPGRARGASVQCIARQLGRAPSTVLREPSRNSDRRGEYRATSAHALAWAASQSSHARQALVNQRLRAIVEQLLERRYSPEQIAGRLHVKFPANPGLAGIRSPTQGPVLRSRARGVERTGAEENKVFVRRFIENVASGRDVSVADDVLASGYVNLAFPGVEIAGLKAMTAALSAVSTNHRPTARGQRRCWVCLT
jgi:hypothetical protein